MSAALPFEPTSVRTSSNGTIAFWQRGPVVYTRVHGHFSQDHAQRLIKHVDSAIALGTAVEQFHDWGEMTTYDLAAQKDLTVWTIRVRKNVRNLTILVHSPVVLLGVKLANSILRGMIHVCEDRDEFVKAISTRLAPSRAASVS